MTDYPHQLPSSRQKRQIKSQATVITLDSSSYVADTGISSIHFFFKRLMDLSFSISALILLAPFLLLLALLIQIDSHGPVFYTQERIGSRRVRRNGRLVWEQYEFKMYKFRSMYQGSSSLLHQQFAIAFIHNDEARMNEINQQVALENQSTEDPNACQYKINCDPRVTRIGKFLRKTSLDELPQIINVIRGEMSLVGPRPPLPYEVQEYQHWHHRRFAAYQGLTGYWQIVGRSEVNFDKMIELDIWYTKHQSIWLDLKIILLTPLQVLKGKGAK